jgi:hypothetical protein
MITSNTELSIAVNVSLICNSCELRLCKRVPKYLIGRHLFDVGFIEFFFSTGSYVCCVAARS